MRFITRFENASFVIRPADKVLVGSHLQRTKPLRAEFRGGVFDSEISARRFNWTEDEKVQVEEGLLMHFDFGEPGGFTLEPGQKLPPWAKEMYPDLDEKVDPKQLAGGACQYVYSSDKPEGTVMEGCQFQAISEDVPYCVKHAPEAGFEIEFKVTKRPDGKEPEQETVKKKRVLSPEQQQAMAEGKAKKKAEREAAAAVA